MKALEIYLMSMGGLLALAILAGVVVWYLYQDLSGANPQALLEGNETGENREEPSDTSVREMNAPASSEEVSPMTPQDTITPESLTENERAVLASFSSNDSFVVTKDMISCAQDAVGDTRLKAILRGSAPTPLEALSLMPCMK